MEELTKQLEAAARVKPVMKLYHIQDNEEKMLMYTSFKYDIFSIVLKSLQRFELQYYSNWRPSMALQDQLLLTLMKLKLNLRDLDLADRFGISTATVANIFHTLVCALHEICFEGIMEQGMPSQVFIAIWCHKATMSYYWAVIWNMKPDTEIFHFHGWVFLSNHLF